MEDSVGEEERREQGEAMVQAVKKDEQVVAGGGGGEPGEEGGLLSAMASKIGAAMVGGNENRGVNGGTVNATAASSGEEKKGDGHGGGGIFQKFMSSSHAPSPDSRAPGTEEVKGEGKTQDAGGEQGGILNSMASRIGMTMSSANDNGDHSTAGDAKMSNGDAIDNVKGVDQDKGDEANGGILSAMASKIGMSGANGDGNRGGSGVDARTSNGNAAAGSKVEEKGGEANGGGLVDQIMSNLPSDDHAPEADEASLLIAIIED